MKGVLEYLFVLVSVADITLSGSQSQMYHLTVHRAEIQCGYLGQSESAASFWCSWREFASIDFDLSFYLQSHQCDIFLTLLSLQPDRVNPNPI